MNDALRAVEQMTVAVITPTVAARVLGCNPYSITIAAREKPGALGFPVIVIGTRTLIPRVPFINFISGQDGGETNER